MKTAYKPLTFFTLSLIFLGRCGLSWPIGVISHIAFALVAYHPGIGRLINAHCCGSNLIYAQ